MRCLIGIHVYGRRKMVSLYERIEREIWSHDWEMSRHGSIVHIQVKDGVVNFWSDTGVVTKRVDSTDFSMSDLDFANFHKHVTVGEDAVQQLRCFGVRDTVGKCDRIAYGKHPNGWWVVNPKYAVCKGCKTPGRRIPFSGHYDSSEDEEDYHEAQCCRCRVMGKRGGKMGSFIFCYDDHCDGLYCYECHAVIHYNP